MSDTQIVPGAPIPARWQTAHARIVFRLEHRSDGLGPYTPRRSTRPIPTLRGVRLPLPFEDRRIREAFATVADFVDSGARSACLSLESLRRWFLADPDHASLATPDWVVRGYHLPPGTCLVIGAQQVAVLATSLTPAACCYEAPWVVVRDGLAPTPPRTAAEEAAAPPSRRAWR